MASVGEDGLEISGDGIRILTRESELPQQESADAAGSDDAPAAADALDAALAAIEAAVHFLFARICVCFGGSFNSINTIFVDPVYALTVVHTRSQWHH